MRDELKLKIQELEETIKAKQTEYATLLTEFDNAADEVKSELKDKRAEAERELDTLKAAHADLGGRYQRLGNTSVTFDSAPTSIPPVGKTLEEIMGNFTEKLENIYDKKAPQRKSVGTHIANFLLNCGIKNKDDYDFILGNNTYTFKFNFDENDVEGVKEVENSTPIKSIYTNHGSPLVVSGTPVPGSQGYGCTIFEVTDECRICYQPTNFIDCLTVRNMGYGNQVQYTYQVSRDNNASGVLETIYNEFPTFAQDGTKPLSTFTYETTKVPAVKLAHGIVVSDEAFEDCGNVAERIDFELTSGLLRERDRQLIAGDGTLGNMLGLLNQPGILALNATTLTAGMTTPNIWDKLYLAKLELEQNCANVDCVIINPKDKAKVMLAKDANGQYLFPQGDGCDVSRVGCLSLKTSIDVPAGTALMGEMANNWVWYNRKNLTIKVGHVGNQFLTNTRTFLAELRGAVVLHCPNKVAKIINI